MAELEGLAALEAALAAKLAKLASVSDDAMLDNALHLQGESAQLAPVETGELRSSATITQGVADRSYEVRFTAPYAIYQHEALDWQHPRGGQAKFLEQPFAANIDRYVRHVAEKAKGAL